MTAGLYSIIRRRREPLLPKDVPANVPPAPTLPVPPKPTTTPIEPEPVKLEEKHDITAASSNPPPVESRASIGSASDLSIPSSANDKSKSPPTPKAPDNLNPRPELSFSRGEENQNCRIDEPLRGWARMRASLPTRNEQPSTQIPLSCSSLVARFAATARDAGCPHDQMLNFINAGILLQPRQLLASAAARSCDLPEGPTAIGFGGARGGGKSYWLLAQMGIDDCQRVPGLKCLLLRKVGKSNLENFEDLRQRLFRRLPHEFSLSRTTLRFENGSRIIAGHFQCEKDIDAYLGLEYDIIGIEEATTLTSRKYHDIVTCCRSSRVLPDQRHWRPRIYSTTNPGGIGHAWYRSQYVVPFQQRTETATRFIPATINDNSFTNPEYKDTLDHLSGWQKRAWRDGDWDIAAGQFFTNFRRDVHVIDRFNENQALEWFAALDYGFNHYTVALLGCKDSDGNIYVVDEHAQRGWVPMRHAEAIKAMLQRHRVQLSSRDRYATVLRRFVAGTDLFARQGTGVSIAQHYAEFGLTLRPANMDRVNGWAEILKRFGDPAQGIPPRLFIHCRCTRLLECLPTLQHDPSRPEDVLKVDPDDDGVGGDDAADALRYLVATRPVEVVARKLRGW